MLLIAKNLVFKLQAIVWRLWDFIRLLPLRAKRLVFHLYYGFIGMPGHLLVFVKTKEASSRFWMGMQWLLELQLLLMDLIGTSELYESLQDFIKFNTRPLKPEEIALAQKVFGDTITYQRVRVDEAAMLGPRQKHFAYVSYYTINSWGYLQEAIFLHELVHVWQYERMGAVYMPRALRAQRSKMGYNYGGVARLKAIKSAGLDIWALNLEQQGDLIADYYRIKNGGVPQWGRGLRTDLELYEYFVLQFRNSLDKDKL